MAVAKILTLKLLLVCVCICAWQGTPAMVCMWRSEDNNVESLLSFYPYMVFVRIKLSSLGFPVSALPPKHHAAPSPCTYLMC